MEEEGVRMRIPRDNSTTIGPLMLPAKQLPAEPDWTAVHVLALFRYLSPRADDPSRILMTLEPAAVCGGNPEDVATSVPPTASWLSLRSVLNPSHTAQRLVLVRSIVGGEGSIHNPDRFNGEPTSLDLWNWFTKTQPDLCEPPGNLIALGTIASYYTCPCARQHYYVLPVYAYFCYAIKPPDSVVVV